uniref:Uncharacterized protein n=1 Tax=Desulfobacca acetoxidans TaxID=60893 RepID=A0A7C5EVU7_9BACT
MAAMLFGQWSARKSLRTWSST